MTKITGDWLRNSGTRAAMTMLTQAGHQAYFVGGCVRNTLLGVAVADVDIATDARPERVIELAGHRRLRIIPTGIDHGTVTLICDGTAHEITTFRKDIETDGRRARVSFSDNMTDDARRRDFTMNAIYADQDGLVFDPLGGLGDLKAGRVRFIDDAASRIKEDYLRSLRFFRFLAWYGDPAAGVDAAALAAIAENLGGISALSKERIGAEIKKTLSATDPAPAMAAMQQSGVLQLILPGATSRYLAALIHLEGGDEAAPIRRLAALGGTGVRDRLRLSRDEYRRLTGLREILATDARGLAGGYRFGADATVDGELLRCAMLGQPLPKDFRKLAEQGAALKFPVAASDLMPELTGQTLGKRLKLLEERWIHSDFKLTRSQLLA